MVEHGYTGHIDPTHQGHYVSHPDAHPIHIERIDARQMHDSHGYPTVAVTMYLDDGAVLSATVPADAFEAAELRDDGPTSPVTQAVSP